MPRSETKPVAVKKAEALSDEQFLAISKAVADPRRFAILQQVAAFQAGPLACSNLQEHNVISPATISHHIKELAEAGLIQVEREGRCGNLILQRGVWDAYLRRLSSL
ncbi:MAG TPA: helix-turn-helix domain-containing protein [Edaphobacter sp.]|jgi:ArsR family transcriptional regulator|nr:helix-turn-helix domain-containing protein [Edaphobacter sp.]